MTALSLTVGGHTRPSSLHNFPCRDRRRKHCRLQQRSQSIANSIFQSFFSPFYDRGFAPLWTSFSRCTSIRVVEHNQRRSSLESLPMNAPPTMPDNGMPVQAPATRPTVPPTSILKRPSQSPPRLICPNPGHVGSSTLLAVVGRSRLYAILTMFNRRIHLRQVSMRLGLRHQLRL